MPRLIFTLCVIAMTAILLWLIYQTSFGGLVGSLLPDGFWLWFHAGPEGQGAELGYDLEWVIFALLSLILSISTVSIISRWLFKRRE